MASERLGFRPSLVRELNILFLFSGGLFTGSTVMLEEGHCPVRGSIADVRLGDSRTFQDGAAAYAMLPSKSGGSGDASAQRSRSGAGLGPTSLALRGGR